jgi:hypothetical protein
MSYPNWLGQGVGATGPTGPAPLAIVPSPTQLNGTGTTVDLISRANMASGLNISLPNDTSLVTLFTTTQSFPAGTYFVMCGFFYYKDGSGAPDYNTNENYNFDVTSSSATAAQCDLTISPYYFCDKSIASQFPGYAQMSGYLVLSGTATMTVRLQRFNPSTSKIARVDWMTVQKTNAFT